MLRTIELPRRIIRRLHSPRLHAEMRLIGITRLDNFKACQSQDLEVEQQARVVDLPEITIHSPFHLLEARCLATKNADLRPARYPRFHMMSESVSG